MIAFVWPAPCHLLPCTEYWDDDDWNRYWRSHRPKSYHGGETDTEAWDRWVHVNHATQAAAFLRRHHVNEDVVLEVYAISPREEGPQPQG